MKLLQQLSSFIIIFMLVACGGGEGGGLSVDGNGDSSTAEKTIAIALSSSSVTGAEPITVSAQVMQGKTPVSNEVVTFSSTLGVIIPTSSTALTNAEGIATITLTAGTVRGAGDITASISSGAEAKIGFATQGDDIPLNDVSVSVKLYGPDGVETQTITSTKPGTLVATVTGVNTPTIVNFASDKGEIPIPTAVTDGNNQASVVIEAGTSLGAGTVNASLSSGESGSTIVVVGATNVRMGSGDPFVEKVAEVSLPQISAGGTTVVSVKIVDDEGNLFTETIDVNFSTGCSSQSTPTATISSPITTSNGIASSTYLAQGCFGDDPINVSANAGGVSLSALASVNVLPANVGSLEFVSAEPTSIGIIGTGALGGSESSTVKFKVLDTNGNPVNGQVVNFALNTDIGGINIIPMQATTDINGMAQTVINSGTVATTVRVTASIDGTNPLISSQSSNLAISTGIPDQDSFSLSANILNPEGWDRDGSEVEVTARLSDAFNNPVPDGTTVIFTTEGGDIQPSCNTVNGACTVIWESQNPRPFGNELTNQFCGPTLSTGCAERNNSMGQRLGGRSTILATAIGEESFPDLNGNGRFDASEVSAFKGLDTSGEPFDKKEAFVDHNEDGIFNPEESGGDNVGGELEEPSDFNVNGKFDGADGKYNGVLCSIPAHAGCSTDVKSINVRRSLVLVMSGETAYFKIEATNDQVASTIQQCIDDDSNAGTDNCDDSTASGQVAGDGTPDTNNTQVTNPVNNPNDTTIYLAGESTGSLVVTIADLHNQPMPAGTTVTFNAGVGSIVGKSSFVWTNTNHNGGTTFQVFVKGEKDPTSGPLSIEVETPSGTFTGASVGIVVQ